MRFTLSHAIAATELADRLGARLAGASVSVTGVAAIDSLAPGTLTYWQAREPFERSLPDGVCVLARSQAACPAAAAACVLEIRNPRLAFVRLLQWFEEAGLLGTPTKSEIHPSARIHSTAIVETGASVGSDTEVAAGAHLGSACVIGDSVKIRPGAVIGQAGFGFERDESGIPLEFPHLGRVVIEDGCVIGCNATIARGNLNDTRIARNVKIDDQVYLAHNCRIGESTMVAGGARICGSVVVGSKCWIGAGAMIRQGLEIGDNAIVGLGAVVVNSVAADAVVAGNPARLLREI